MPKKDRRHARTYQLRCAECNEPLRATRPDAMYHERCKAKAYRRRLRLAAIDQHSSAARQAFERGQRDNESWNWLAPRRSAEQVDLEVYKVLRKTGRFSHEECMRRATPGFEPDIDWELYRRGVLWKREEK